jgi:lysine 6-dehydrogenase
MRMLVMGAGLQGSACAYDLLQNPDVERVTIADQRLDRLPRFLEPYRTDPRVELVALDAREGDAVLAVMRTVDACLNALPYYFNFEISTYAVEAGIHCCDLGGNTEIVFQQERSLDVRAAERRVSVVPDSGLAPGMVNILAEAGIRAVDHADSVRIYVGGLPQHPAPPLNYQIVYSLHGVLDYYTTPSWVLRGGEPTQVDALSEVEAVTFEDPVGTLEAFHTAGGLSTMARTYRGAIRTMEYKTLRYPGHAEVMRSIRGLGLLDLQPVTVGDGAVVPRDVFIACAEPRLHRPESRDLVALRVEVEGTRDGMPHRVIFDLVDLYDESRGVSAMERTTGFSLSITGQLQVQGRVTGPGVRTPDRAVPAEAYIEELAHRGIAIRRTVEAGAVR